MRCAQLLQVRTEFFLVRLAVIMGLGLSNALAWALSADVEEFLEVLCIRQLCSKRAALDVCGRLSSSSKSLFMKI